MKILLMYINMDFRDKQSFLYPWISPSVLRNDYFYTSLGATLNNLWEGVLVFYTIVLIKY